MNTRRYMIAWSLQKAIFIFGFNVIIIEQQQIAKEEQEEQKL